MSEPNYVVDAREISRQRRVVDQQLTIYSILRDRYQRCAVVSTLLILAGSLVVTAFAFTSNNATIRLPGVSASRTIWIGWLGLAVFFITLIDLVVDWKKKAERYGEAARRLGALKSSYRGLNFERLNSDEIANLSRHYGSVMGDAPPIRDRTFIRLKAAHIRKVALSRLISEHPGASVLRLRLRLWRESVRAGRSLGTGRGARRDGN
jgi:hypothetical protein